MFADRTLAQSLKKVTKTFPVVLVTGPRQVGKTTLLEKCAPPSMKYVSLDSLPERALAQEDPALFIQRYAPPVIIDEIQYAPELFTSIKIEVDKQHQHGLFWLTGSQKFHVMRNVSETLAGRVAILDLLGLSIAEQEGCAATSRPFLPIPELLGEMEKHAKPISLMEIYHKIWTGSFPVVALNPEVDRDLFYNSYLQTYVERDVRDLTRVGDEAAFLKFLRATAARTGQLLNMSDLARDVSIDPKTAKSWLSILETAGLIYLLQPYHTNLTKRLVKAPKLYFLDTGLCCHLMRWTSPETLEAGAMSGAMLETFVFSEMIKSYWHNAKSPVCYFYRDKDQKEVDLLIEKNGMLYPVEIKKTATPDKRIVKHFETLSRLGLPIGHGGVVCLTETHIPLTKEADAIPVNYL